MRSLSRRHPLTSLYKLRAGNVLPHMPSLLTARRTGLISCAKCSPRSKARLELSPRSLSPGCVRMSGHCSADPKYQSSYCTASCPDGVGTLAGTSISHWRCMRQENDVEREFQIHRSDQDYALAEFYRWAIAFLIGVTMGCLGFIVDWGIGTLNNFKYNNTFDIVNSHGAQRAKN